MTDGALTSLSGLRAGAADSIVAAPEATRRRSPSRSLLLNVVGWLLFGIAIMIGSLDVMPWDVILATESVYVLVGLSLALLLVRIYDRLGVRPGAFGRTLAISAVGACAAGMLWNGTHSHRRRASRQRPVTAEIGCERSLRSANANVDNRSPDAKWPQR